MLPPAPQVQRNTGLEDDLQTHSRGSATTTDEVVVQKSSRGGVSHVSARQAGLLRMVEGIERLDAPFDLRVLPDAENLEETQVEVLDRI